MIQAKLSRSEVSHYQLEWNHVKLDINQTSLKLSGSFEHVFGFGEKYNAINQKGQHIENKVYDQFCNQNEKTYFPLPFFFIKEGLESFYIQDVYLNSILKRMLLSISVL